MNSKIHRSLVGLFFYEPNLGFSNNFFINKFFLDSFIGFLIEIDNANVVHIRSLHFKFSRIDTYIPERIAIAKPLETLLGCSKGRDFEKRDFKGIYFSPDTHLSYVFINTHYLKGEFDMLSRNFKIDTSKWIQYASTSDLKGSKVVFERRSIKYIKQTRTTTYLTINPSSTYQLEFQSDEKNGEGQFVAKQVNDKLAHLCPNQILEINRIIFCFEQTVSRRPEINSIDFN